jgi:hypothetical protein
MHCHRCGGDHHPSKHNFYCQGPHCITGHYDCVARCILCGVQGHHARVCTCPKREDFTPPPFAIVAELPPASGAVPVDAPPAAGPSRRHRRHRAPAGVLPDLPPHVPDGSVASAVMTPQPAPGLSGQSAPAPSSSCPRPRPAYGGAKDSVASLCQYGTAVMATSLASLPPSTCDTFTNSLDKDDAAALAAHDASFPTMDDFAPTDAEIEVSFLEVSRETDQLQRAQQSAE